MEVYEKIQKEENYLTAMEVAMSCGIMDKTNNYYERFVEDYLTDYLTYNKRPQYYKEYDSILKKAYDTESVRSLITRIKKIKLIGSGPFLSCNIKLSTGLYSLHVHQESFDNALRLIKNKHYQELYDKLLAIYKECIHSLPAKYRGKETKAMCKKCPYCMKDSLGICSGCLIRALGDSMGDINWNLSCTYDVILNDFQKDIVVFFEEVEKRCMKRKTCSGCVCDREDKCVLKKKPYEWKKDLKILADTIKAATEPEEKERSLIA